MTITDVRVLVSDGVCTWLQVYETLINAGTTHRTRRLFLDGQVELNLSSNFMLGELARSGVVPLSRYDRQSRDASGLQERGVDASRPVNHLLHANYIDVSLPLFQGAGQ